MADAPAQLWWTAAEIAAACLPDLPTTKRRVNALAEREAWIRQEGRARRRAGRGGGWEYHWTLFPSRAQAWLVQQAKVAAAPTRKKGRTPTERKSREESWAWFERLPETRKAVARERLSIIQVVEALEAGGATRQIAVADAARASGKSERAVWDWLRLVRGVRVDDRLPYLAPQGRGAAESPRRAEIDPRFGDLVKADYLRLEAPTLTSCYDRAVRIARAQGVPVVPLHTVRRWIDRTVSDTAQTLAREGMEALKRLRPAQVRDKTAMHAMEGVNGDFHRFDVMVRFPSGPGGQEEEIGRPQMVAFQDIYSGRLLAYRVDRSANSNAVQLCIGDMIERWGIPEHVLLDNGREFAAKLITGGVPTRFRFKVKHDDPSGLLTSLGCQIHFAMPYSGQSKPIERSFRDLCDRVAKHPAFAGAYTGNRPDAKPENYGSRAVPLAEFLAVLADEIEQHNSRQGRRSEVAWGRSFAEVFDESYAVAPIRKATAEQRRLWLMGAEGIRANSQTGAIRFMGNTYWADWMHEIAGRRIVARFDRAALWEGLHLYGLDDRYLGHAPCTVKAGFFDVDDSRAHAKRLAEWKAARKAELAAHRRLTAADVAAQLGALTPAAPAAPVEATVIRPVFDGPKTPAPPAPAEREAPPDPPAVVIADLARRRAARVQTRVDDAGRETFARARELERALDRGEPVTKEQQLWLEGYRRTPEYRTWTQMVADFGEGVLTG